MMLHNGPEGALRANQKRATMKKTTIEYSAEVKKTISNICVEQDGKFVDKSVGQMGTNPLEAGGVVPN